MKKAFTLPMYPKKFDIPVQSYWKAAEIVEAAGVCVLDIRKHQKFATTARAMLAAVQRIRKMTSERCGSQPELSERSDSAFADFQRQQKGEDGSPMGDMVESFAEYFEVLPATTPELELAAYRLRYNVYSTEIKLPGFEAENFPDQLESDGYDGHSLQSLLRHRPTSDFAGLVRLVLAPKDEAGKPFPVESFAGDSLDKARLDDLPRQHTGELSRLILSSSFRRRRGEADTGLGKASPTWQSGKEKRRRFPHPILGLMVATMRLSVENGVTHWLAGMEPRLNRVLERFGLGLIPIGPEIEYYGIRRPYMGSVSDVMGKAYQVDRGVWELLTDSGRLHPPPSS